MIFKKLASILEDIFDLDENTIKPETSFIDDLGADLPDMIELSMIIEEEFDVLIDDEDLANINTVDDMVEYIKNHTDN
ncbi:MAG: acpP [Clostridia bacterium]|nr:acpP [Clostridia bacterium]